MDVQLKELIEKIKSEGVHTAEEQATGIISEAEKRADAIIKKAQNESRRIVETAEKEAEKLQITGKEALKQAGRNLLLALKNKIEQLFKEVIVQESDKVLHGKNLESAIVNIIGSLKPDELQDMSLMVGTKDFKELENGLRAALSDALKSGMELKPVETASAGFRFTEKDGASYFNYTAEGIADILCEYLNPRLSEILREAVREE